MATKKVKWFQKDGSLLHPETDWASIIDKPTIPDVSGFVKKTGDTMTGALRVFSAADGSESSISALGITLVNSGGEASLGALDGLRLIDSTKVVTFSTSGFAVQSPAGSVAKTINLPTSSGTLALKSDIKTYTASTGISISSSNAISTTAASSTASGHVNTTTQTFAGRKTFNGGINIPSGATIQLNGSSGTAGSVMTSNGTSSAPSWKNGNTVISLLSTKTTFTTGSVYLASNWWDTYDELRVMIQEPDGPWAERSVLASWAKSYATASGATTSVVFNISDADTARWFWAYFTSSSMYISSGVKIGGIRVYGVKYGIHS